MCQQRVLRLCSLALEGAGRERLLFWVQVGLSWGLQSHGLWPCLSPAWYQQGHLIAPSSGRLSIQTPGWAQRQLYRSVHCRNYPANCFQADEIWAAAAAGPDHQRSRWGWNIRSLVSAGVYQSARTRESATRSPPNALGSVIFKINMERQPLTATWKSDPSPKLDSKFSTRSILYVWSHCKGLPHKTVLGKGELSACRHFDVF